MKPAIAPTEVRTIADRQPEGGYCGAPTTTRGMISAAVIAARPISSSVRLAEKASQITGSRKSPPYPEEPPPSLARSRFASARYPSGIASCIVRGKRVQRKEREIRAMPIAAAIATSRVSRSGPGMTISANATPTASVVASDGWSTTLSSAERTEVASRLVDGVRLIRLRTAIPPHTVSAPPPYFPTVNR